MSVDVTVALFYLRPKLTEVNRVWSQSQQGAGALPAAPG